MICLDNKQSERPCEGEGKPCKQSSERETPDETLSLLVEGKVGLGRRLFLQSLQMANNANRTIATFRPNSTSKFENQRKAKTQF